MTEIVRIGELHNRSGLTQKQVAKELFISQSHLRKIEHRYTTPTANTADKVVSYLGQHRTMI